VFDAATVGAETGAPATAAPDAATPASASQTSTRAVCKNERSEKATFGLIGSPGIAQENEFALNRISGRRRYRRAYVFIECNRMHGLQGISWRAYDHCCGVPSPQQHENKGDSSTWSRALRR
jgi:hypothetical protein